MERAKIQNIIAYILNPADANIPNWIGTSKSAKSRFRASYNPAFQDKWRVHAGKLYCYRANNAPNVNNNNIGPGVEVIPHEDYERTLNTMFDDPRQRVLGRDRFYMRVCEKYYNIRLCDVQDFLRRQELYQLHNAAPKLKSARPLTPSRPAEHLQVDTIFMRTFPRNREEGWIPPIVRRNDGYAYILTIIDSYSKRAWAIPKKGNTQGETTEIMRNFLNGIDIKPGVIQTDSGPEFGDGSLQSEFHTMITGEMHLRHFYSAAYTPQQNAYIERFNRTLKQAIFADMTHTGTDVWITGLAEIVKNYNETYHTTIKAKPIEVWRMRGIDELGNITRKIKNRANNIIASENRLFPEIVRGDYCRVLITAIDPDRRKQALSHIGEGSKKYKQGWSNDVYLVTSVSRPNDANLQLRSAKYTLWRATEQGVRIEAAGSFTRDKLQKIELFGMRKIPRNAVERPVHPPEVPPVPPEDEDSDDEIPLIPRRARPRLINPPENAPAEARQGRIRRAPQRFDDEF